MGQVTWRADDELIRRVKDAARHEGRSMNDYLTTVMDAATNTDLETDPRKRLQERLRAAGLLQEPGPPVERPDPAAVARAAKEYVEAGPPWLSDIISQDRDEQWR